MKPLSRDKYNPGGQWVIGNGYGDYFLWPIWALGFAVFAIAAFALAPFWVPIVVLMHVLEKREPKPTVRAPLPPDYETAAIARNRIALGIDNPRRNWRDREG